LGGVVGLVVDEDGVGGGMLAQQDVEAGSSRPDRCWEFSGSELSTVGVRATCRVEFFLNASLGISFKFGLVTSTPTHPPFLPPLKHLYTL